MNFNRRDAIYFLPVIFIFLFTLTLSLPSPLIGSDLIFQLNLMKLLSKGDLAGWLNLALSVNRIFYPPLFQILLFPVLIFGFGYVAILQSLFLPLAVLSLELLFYLRGRKFEAAFIGTLVLSSFAFVDRSLQVIPVALDFILLPLCVYFGLYSSVEKNNDKWFILFSSIVLYNHGIMGVSVLGGLFLYKLYRREWKTILMIFLISLPITLASLPYIPSALNNFGGKINTDQQRAFLANPLLFTWEYMGQSLVVGFPIILFGYVVAAWKVLKRNLDEIDKVSIFTLGSMLLTTFFQQDRFLQYSTIPLAILLANHVSQSKDRTSWTIVAVGLASFFYAILWIWLAVGMFDVQLPYKL